MRFGGAREVTGSGREIFGVEVAIARFNKTDEDAAQGTLENEFPLRSFFGLRPVTECANEVQSLFCSLTGSCFVRGEAG